MVLRKQPIATPPVPEALVLDWQSEFGQIDTLTHYLTRDQPARLRVTGIPNRRLTDDLAPASAVQSADAGDTLDLSVTGTIEAHNITGGHNQLLQPDALSQLGLILSTRLHTREAHATECGGRQQT
ncbi:hypothetical protein [Streptomyces sp. NPDC050560]|uniref:hypothetical protein n=1 Tax=Streptomyces sp. NPDC050560 TaxID=3365630 RepID=UPI0037A92DCE